MSLPQTNFHPIPQSSDDEPDAPAASEQEQKTLIVPPDSTSEQDPDTPTAADADHEGPHTKHNHGRLFRTLLKDTAPWVIGGMAIMFSGTVVCALVFFERIYDCYPELVCPNQLMPTINPIALIQVPTQYCLQLGFMISGVGILKLVSYHCAYMVHHKGSTISTLEHHLGMAKDSTYEGLLLLVKRGNRTLGAIILCKFIIVGIIPLIVGLTIPTPGFSVKELSYDRAFQLPDESQDGFLSVGQEKAQEWLKSYQPSCTTNSEFLHQFLGTLIIKDIRLDAVLPRPSGPVISSSTSCSGKNIQISQSTTLNSSIYNISIPSASTSFSFNGSSPSDFSARILRSAVLSSRPGAMQSDILWITSPYVVQNATTTPDARTTPDGSWEVSVCNHTSWFDIHSDLTSLYIPPPRFVQQIMPSFPRASADPGSNASDNHNNLDLLLSSTLQLLPALWSPYADQDGFTRLYLTPAPHVDSHFIFPWTPRFGYQHMTFPELSSSWSVTIMLMLNALVQTGKSFDYGTQRLVVHDDSLGFFYPWWLQTLIPVLTFFLYVVSFWYVLSRNQGETVKELSLLDVATALETVDPAVRRSGLTKDTWVGGAGLEQHGQAP